MTILVVLLSLFFMSFLAAAIIFALSTRGGPSAQDKARMQIMEDKSQALERSLMAMQSGLADRDAKLQAMQKNLDTLKSATDIDFSIVKKRLDDELDTLEDRVDALERAKLEAKKSDDRLNEAFFRSTRPEAVNLNIKPSVTEPVSNVKNPPIPEIATPKTPNKPVEKIIEKPVSAIEEKAVEKSPDKAITEKTIEKSVEKTIDKPAEKSADEIKSPLKGSEKTNTEKPVIEMPKKVEEKAAEKPVEKPIIKELEKDSSEKAADKPIEKAQEKPVEKTVEKTGEKPSEKIPEKSAEKAPEKSTLPSEKPPTTPAAAPGATAPQPTPPEGAPKSQSNVDKKTVDDILALLQKQKKQT